MSTLDPLVEGYLTYLLEVGRKAPRTVVDVRCTLKRTVEAFATRRPGVSLWKLALEDYLHWFEAEREGARSDASLAKDASHIRGLLEYGLDLRLLLVRQGELIGHSLHLLLNGEPLLPTFFCVFGGILCGHQGTACHQPAQRQRCD